MTMKITVTDAQQVIIRALLSMAGSALVGAVQLEYQYMAKQGRVDIPTALGFALGTFGTLFSTMLYAYIPAHHAQALAAANDTALQAEQAYMHLQNTLLAQKTTAQPIASPSVQEASQSTLGPLVVMHVNGVTPSMQGAVAVSTPTPVVATIPPRPRAHQLVPIEHPPEETPILAPVEVDPVQADVPQVPLQGPQAIPAVKVAPLSTDTMPRAAVSRQVQ